MDSFVYYYFFFFSIFSSSLLKYVRDGNVPCDCADQWRCAHWWIANKANAIICVWKVANMMKRRVRDGIAGVHHGASVSKYVLRTKTQSTKEAEPASVFCWPLHNECACSFVRLLEKSPQNLHDFCTVAFKSRRTLYHFNAFAVEFVTGRKSLFSICCCYWCSHFCDGYNFSLIFFSFIWLILLCL